MRLFVVLVTIFLFGSSCGSKGQMRYGKVLKSKDINLKYDYALKYYEEGECFKALPILDELFGLVRGTALYEDVYYYYAKTTYCVQDFYLANYYSKNFARTFSNSPRAEELTFLAAMSSYQNSPEFSLDQKSTESALNEFQLFLDSYPGSSLKDSCENMMGRLSFKLEKKAVEIAKLYVKTEKFKSGTIAVQNVIDTYPDSQFREELYFLRVQTWFEYAQASVESKKKERFLECVKSYTNFVTAFPDSSRIKEAEDLYAKAYSELERLG